jgi:glutamyl-tRNA synthetase
MSTVRVRYAPSPTGHLHLGGLRTALFNWLFARHNKGVFLLRIEDTDIERSKPEYTASLLEALAWADLASDEPVVIQTENIPLHKQVLARMLQEGTAYRCFCTPQELQARLGASAAQEGSYTKYDRMCRDKVISEEDLKKPYAIRFKLPDNVPSISFDDLIRGTITFDRDQFDDFIIMRSDGTPMYNFVVVVDDAHMRITHVLRGEDHISNTPKQILLYQACGYPLPLFGHFPMILGPDGNRLSKRDAATAVLDYKYGGFLADALCNYLVRLGWSHGDQEIFTKEELVAYFSLDHVGKKGAIFDMKKLEWMNSMYLKKLSPEALIRYIEHDVDPLFRTYFPEWNASTLAHGIDIYKERVKTLKELVCELRSLYQRTLTFDEEEIKTWDTQETRNDMKMLEDALKVQEDFSVQALSEMTKSLCARLNRALPQIAKPLRIALTGKSSSPGVFEVLALLGKNETIARLHHFRQTLAKEEGVKR